MGMNRRLFFGSILGAGAATALKVDAERQPEAIRDGDVLVLEHPGSLGEDAYHNIAISAQRALPGIKVLVLEDGMKARLLRPEVAEALSVVLQREGL
jgi:hypothetical protein